MLHVRRQRCYSSPGVSPFTTPNVPDSPPYSDSPVYNLESIFNLPPLDLQVPSEDESTVIGSPTLESPVIESPIMESPQIQFPVWTIEAPEDERCRPIKYSKYSKCHTPRYKALCSFCKKQFPNPSTLKAHMLTHSKIKDYCCSKCHKEFARKHDLNRHMKTVHSNDRPFKCAVCHHGFSTQRRLDFHVMTHHKDSPAIDEPEFQCEICQKIFEKEEYVLKHMEMHNVFGSTKQLYYRKIRR